MNMKTTKLWFIVSMGLAVLVLFLLVAPHYLTVFVQHKIIPPIIEKAGLPPQQVGVRRISMTGADLGPMRISGNGQDFLEIDTLRVTFTPLSLWRREINAIEIVGVSAPLMIDDDHFCLAGFCTSERLKETPTDEPQGLALGNWLPMPVRSIHILQALLTCQWQGLSRDIPLELKLETGQDPQGDLTGTLTLFPGDQPLTVAATARGTTNTADISLTAPHVSPQDFVALWASKTDMNIRADASISAQVTLQLNPLMISQGSLKAVLSRTKLTAGSLTIENIESTLDPIAITLTAQGTENEPIDTIHLAGGPLAMTYPAKLQWTGFEADISRLPENWQLSGRGHTRLPAQSMPILPALALKEPAGLNWEIHGQGRGKTDFDVTFIATDTTGKDALNLAYPPVTISITQPRLEFSAISNAQGLKTKGLVTCGKTQINLDGGMLSSPGITLSVTTSDDDLNRIDADLMIAQPVFSAGSLQASTPEIRVTAQSMPPQQNLPRQTRGRIKLSNARLQARDQDLSVNHIALDLPLQWPSDSRTAKGALTVGDMQWQAQQLGGVAGTLSQRQRALIGDFSHVSQLLPGLKVEAHTVMDAKGLDLRLMLPSFSPREDIDLGRFIPAAEGFQVNGRFQAQAKLVIAAQGLEGTARLAVEQGQIVQESGAIALSGISTTLVFDGLPLLRSAPQQPIRVDAMQIGDITAREFKANYQIEGGNTFFFEKTDLKWCQGNLSTQSFRINPDKNQLDLTVFCDQLNLAQLLTQLGVAQGSGDGAVSGRIPLHWSAGRLAFEQGFLYSSPGQTGTIRLGNTQAFLEGMPQEAPQYVQLDIASEALKDYTYNWAKVNLESQGDVLKMSLKLNGKPNQLLPFAYDQNMGRFMRIQGKGQAEFKGIDIDLNFNIPLNEILDLKDLLGPSPK